MGYFGSMPHNPMTWIDPMATVTSVSYAAPIIRDSLEESDFYSAGNLLHSLS